jgi:hypothetical protein
MIKLLLKKTVLIAILSCIGMQNSTASTETTPSTSRRAGCYVETNLEAKAAGSLLVGFPLITYASYLSANPALIACGALFAIVAAIHAAERYTPEYHLDFAANILENHPDKKTLECTLTETIKVVESAAGESENIEIKTQRLLTSLKRDVEKALSSLRAARDADKIRKAENDQDLVDACIRGIKKDKKMLATANGLLRDLEVNTGLRMAQ